LRILLKKGWAALVFRRNDRDKVSPDPDQAARIVPVPGSSFPFQANSADPQLNFSVINIHAAFSQNLPGAIFFVRAYRKKVDIEDKMPTYMKVLSEKITSRTYHLLTLCKTVPENALLHAFYCG
jgi:hypothetical protein